MKYRVYCYEKDDAVEQIFNLTLEPELEEELKENTFSNFYMIDTEEEVDYSKRYNKELGTFEANPFYKEQISVVEPSKVDELQEQVNLLQMMTIPADTEMEMLKQENEDLKYRLRLIEEKLGL